ncbi:MAG: zinc ribbon domain-containing protein [Pyrinomonadaceae bacterium]|nr:zinc ribbon domain-containing protein [Pyrinomonadaceae bacterium]
MFCPQCGQQQVTDSLRFCSRCGFPLEGVLHLLGSGGAPALYQPAGPREISARRKGVRQGAALFLAGVVLVPVLGVLNAFTHGPSLLDILVPLAAIIFFLGGIMRMLFAALFEEGAPKLHHIVNTAYAPFPVSQLGTQAPMALPPAQHHPAPAWRPHPNTAEVRQPSSVTENTTRLLDKDEPGNR